MRNIFHLTLVQDSVLAGGRYDQLVEMMGGPSTPAIGYYA